MIQVVLKNGKYAIYNTKGGSIPPVVSSVTIPTNIVVNTPISVSYTIVGLTTTITRTWYRGVTVISTSTTSDLYTPVQADAGQPIKCVITATNAAGSSSADSNTVTVLATLLDIYPNASSAYSVRLLRGARYDNALLRVRRSSDNAEVDVFVDTNYGLSLNSNITSRTSGTTLATWVGANSAFVTKWYDQSGNSNDAVQATAANQPTIVASGVLQTDLGKAALQFSGTTSFQATVNWTNLFATYTVAKLNSLAPAVQSFYRDNGATNSTGVIAFNSVRVDTYRVRTTAVSLSSINSTEFGTTTKLITLSSDASNGYAYVNNNLRASNAVSGNVGTIMYIGANGAGNTGGIAGPMSEWITYPSNSNLAAINNSINTYYSVYPIVSDADAQAFVSATGLTSQTQANAVNTLVIGMKAQGLWTKTKAIYPFVGGTATAHKYNLKDPRDVDAAFRLAFSGTWTHDSSGAQPNGVNGYADTYLNTSTNLVRTNAHLALYVVNNPTVGSKYDMGNASNAAMTVDPTYLITRYNSNLVAVGIGDNSYATSSTTTDSRAFWLGGTNGSSTTIIYKNGVSIASASQGAGALSNINLYLGAANAGGITSFYSDKKYAFGSIGTGLSGTDTTNYYNLVQAFQTTLGRSVGPQVVSDPDAQAFVTAANIQDQVQADAVNNLCISMKAQGLWTKMKAVYPIVGGTAAQHKFNLKNPLDTDAAFRLAFAGTWTHSNTGALPNGSNAYANTFVNPSANLTSFNTHLSYYSRTDNESTGVEIGSLTTLGPSYMHMHLRYTGNIWYALLQQNNADSVTNTSSNGFFVGNRTANNVKKHFKNGINLGTITTTTTSVLSNYNTYLGALNSNGTTSNYSTKECAFSSIGDGLTDTEATNYYTIVQAYQTALGRQV